MEGKVAVLGDSDFVMPFSALGLDTFAVGKKPGDTAEMANQIAGRKYTLVVVAENAAKSAEEAFASLQNMATPCIVVVPFTTEPEGFAIKTLGEVLKMATGINILKNN
jgi:vacuolar-type H+-ATPase subunit F/Vma7